MPPVPPIEALLRDLETQDRSKRLAAAFALGEALAGRAAAGAPADPEVARATAALEAIIAEGEYGEAWIRKRAKRALKKIRGDDGPATTPASPEPP